MNPSPKQLTSVYSSVYFFPLNLNDSTTLKKNMVRILRGQFVI